jgi:hypothetical protein
MYGLMRFVDESRSGIGCSGVVQSTSVSDLDGPMLHKVLALARICGRCNGTKRTFFSLFSRAGRLMRGISIKHLLGRGKGGGGDSQGNRECD